MRIVFGLVLIAAGTACSGGSGSTGMVRDSAGVAIILHGAKQTAQAPAWSLGSEPVVIGVVEGEEPYQLHQVSAAARAPDGRILVVNASTAEIRVFDADGTYMHAIGRRGSGPGEFRYPSRIWLLPGDSVAVWDAPLGPRSVFGADGTHVRTEAVDRGAVMAQLGEGRSSEGILPLVNGALLAPTWTVGSEDDIPNDEMFRPQFEMVLVAPDLTASASLGTYGGIEQMFINIEGRRSPATALYSPHYQVGAGGDPLRIALGNGDRYEIRVHDGDGRLVQILRRDGEPARISEADRDAARARRLEYAERSGWRTMAERQLAAIPDQEFFPAHGPLAVDTQGNVWVSEFVRPSDTEMHWAVYDVSGRIIGTLESPLGTTFAAIGPDWVLTIERDELGVERVACYTLHRN